MSAFLPAHPGFYVVAIVANDDEWKAGGSPAYSKAPIIGWMVDENSAEVWPLTIAGAVDCAAIQRPDGCVTQGASWWGSLGDWAEEQAGGWE